MILSLIAAASALALPATVPGSPSTPGQDQRYTKDRLSTEMMEALVGQPIGLVRSGNLAGGERAFEQLLAREIASRGDGSVEAADLLTAFGVLVYAAGVEAGDDALREKSLSYLERSIPAYRTAFGADHPEVAVALNTYADAETEIRGGSASIEAERALEEAYRIRVASLGPQHTETLASLSGLARLRGHPSRTGKDPAKVREAAAMFRTVIAGRPSGTEPELFENKTTARFGLATLYVRNGLIGDALDTAARAVQQAEVEGPAAACVATTESLVFIGVLQEEGFAREAEKLLSGRDPARLLNCLLDGAEGAGTTP